jgi:hypothetical protein
VDGRVLGARFAYQERYPEAEAHRDWFRDHGFTEIHEPAHVNEFYASVRLGERLTVSILEEQAALYNEEMSMSFASLDGDRISVRGHNQASTVPT